MGVLNTFGTQTTNQLPLRWSEPIDFTLSTSDLSHLHWPFYNANHPSSGTAVNLPSEWEYQSGSRDENKRGTITTWKYENDHLYENGEPTHHTHADWYAQDWNYFE